MINEPDVHIFNEHAELAKGFLSLLREQNKLALENSSHFNLAIPGGRSASFLYDEITWLKLPEDLLVNCNIFWTDENCVPYISPESNFGGFMKTLGGKLNQDYVKFFPVPFTVNPAKAADYYNLLLRSMLPDVSAGKSFDVLVLSTGREGQVAALFSGMESLFSSKNAAELVKSPYDGKFRVTITGELINFSGLIVFLITGEENSGIAADLIRKTARAEKYPAFHVSPRSGRLIWFLDRAAASNI